MGIFSRRDDTSTPNGKLYELRYADGDVFAVRGHGEAHKAFDLATAIRLANGEAARGDQLMVTDPETGNVLWVGYPAARGT